jgi:nitrate/nitrite transport system substrate-binding protein
MVEASPTLRADPPARPIRAEALKPVVQEFKGRGTPLKLGMVFPVSTHNYELRYWLAAGGIHPGFYTPTDINGNTGGDVLISVTPPPQMPYEIWKNNPEKVFGVTAAWAEKFPKTHIAVVKALIRAGRWLDASPANRKEAARILSKPEYVGADYSVIANSMTGTWELQRVFPLPCHLSLLQRLCLVSDSNAPMGAGCRRQTRCLV